jgi:hypothetical protein
LSFLPVQRPLGLPPLLLLLLLLLPRDETKIGVDRNDDTVTPGGTCGIERRKHNDRLGMGRRRYEKCAVFCFEHCLCGLRRAFIMIVIYHVAHNWPTSLTLMRCAPATDEKEQGICKSEMQRNGFCVSANYQSDAGPTARVRFAHCGMEIEISLHQHHYN